MSLRLNDITMEGTCTDYYLVHVSVERLSVFICPHVCMYVCVLSKITVLYHSKMVVKWLTIPLGFGIYIPQKKSTKPGKPSIECYGHMFLIAAPMI